MADKETVEKNALYNNKAKLKVKPVDKIKMNKKKYLKQKKFLQILN